MVRVIVVVVVMLVAASCGGGCSGPNQAASTSTRPQDHSTVESPKDDRSEPGDAPAVKRGGDPGGSKGRDRVHPLRGASTAPAGGRATGQSVALLARARLGRHEGFDRLVFEFRGRLPGYRVRYAAPPVREDGSGRRLRVAGRALVQVRLEPASAYDIEAGAVTFGKRRLDGVRSGTRVVREVVRTGDFEGVSTWVVGLRKRVAFRVRTLRGPARVVIDFRSR